MKFVPILFNTPMVKAIDGDRKSRTRREIKSKNAEMTALLINLYAGVDVERCKSELLRVNAPCKKGDILWVRETWQYSDDLEEPYWYKQKMQEELKPEFLKRHKWKPSIFMPKEACRIFLEVLDVQIERLHDISNEEAKKEGIEAHHLITSGYKHYTRPDRFIPFTEENSAKNAFFSLWMSINGAESLDENPFVWVYGFKRIPKPSNFIN